MNLPSNHHSSLIMLRLSITTLFFFSRVAVNRGTSGRIVEGTQGDIDTIVQIWGTAKDAHYFIQLIFVPGRGAREPGIVVVSGDPIESTGCVRGEAVPLIEDCGSVAAVDEVDEEGAGGGRSCICQQAAVGVYIDGLFLFGVLWRVQLAIGSGTRPLESEPGQLSVGERGGMVAYQVGSPVPTDEQDDFLDWCVIRVSRTVGTVL